MPTARFSRYVTPFEATDRLQLLAFQARMFGAATPQTDESHFDWLFEQNPGRREDEPAFWICKRREEIIGQQGAIRFDLKVGHDHYAAAWIVDLMVDPTWRILGVGPALIEACAASSQVTCAVRISDAAYKGFLRAGWIDLGTLSTYLRPLDLAGTVRALTPFGRAAAVAAAAAAPLLKGLDLAHRLRAFGRGPRIEAISRFDERVDQLWKEVSQYYPILSRRDRGALQWRFDMSPARDHYRRLYLNSGGELKGYLVWRTVIVNGERVAFVVDYLCAPRFVAHLFSVCASEAAREKHVAVVCRTLNASIGARLRMRGFIHHRSGTRIMVRPVHERKDLTETLARRENWFVTAADSDIDIGNGDSLMQAPQPAPPPTPRPAAELIATETRMQFLSTISAYRKDSVIRGTRALVKAWLIRLHRLGLSAGVIVLPKHDHAPIADINELRRTRPLWAKRSDLIGVDANSNDQLARLREMVKPFRDEYSENRAYEEAVRGPCGPGYGYVEAQALHGVVRSISPKRIVQIGSGPATHCLIEGVRLNAANGAAPAKVTCLQPNPSGWLKQLPVEIITAPLPSVDRKIFDDLGEGDLLFLDTSHTVRVGGDVSFVFLEILPRLKRGVVIHFHDIFLPYDYQRNADNTIFQWMETAMLHAFLVNNSGCEILFCLSQLHYDRREELMNMFPGYVPQDDKDGLVEKPNPLTARRTSDFPSSIFLRAKGLPRRRRSAGRRPPASQ